MAEFRLSAFADEITPDFTGQLEALKRLEIDMLELRGADGKNFTELNNGEIKLIGKKLGDSGIALSALGSPLGKAKVGERIAPQLELLDKICDIGEELDCRRIRMFSFYPDENMKREDFRSVVFDYIEALLESAEKRGFTLCHENEKAIYGESAEQVLELASHFDGRLKLVLDNANFVFSGRDASNAYALLNEYIEYLHIKDSDGEGSIVPPGEGNAYIEETLRKMYIDRQREEGEIILTVEPHLMDFCGLAQLAHDGEIKHKFSFDSPFTAFSAAVSAVRQMLDRI